MNEDTKENICVFYTGDYHFEMISLPYIDSKMQNNEEVIILTQTNLEETIKTLLEKTNLKKEKQQKILQLNWKNEDEKKLEKIENQQQNMIIFVKGKEDYIQYTKRIINEKTQNNKNITIIDCYDIEEIGEKANGIMQQYNKILGTAGEKEIEKIIEK